MSENLHKPQRKKFDLGNDRDVEEVVRILAGGSDVEDLSGSDSDGLFEVDPVNLLRDEETDSYSDSNYADNVVPQNVDAEEDATSIRPLIWKRMEFQSSSRALAISTSITTNVLLPIEYFKKYFPESHFLDAAKYTNMYYLKTAGKELKTNPIEIKKLYGAHLYFSCIKLPRIRMYWQSQFRHNLVASNLSRNRFTLLRKCLHFVDTTIPPSGWSDNGFWKVQPIIEAVRSHCLNINRNFLNYSIDKQMIPFLGRCPNRQYVRNKPRPVGLKNFVLTSSSGIVLDFELYQGAKTPLRDRNLGLGPSVILRLVRTLPEKSFVYFDRFFTTIPLLEKLSGLNINATGTIQNNRIRKIDLMSDKKMCRGEIDEIVRSDEKIVVVKWMDNKSVTLAYTAFGKNPVSSVTRWSKQDNSRIEVPCPVVVKEYNNYMGGVDICDQMMECYRTWIKTKKLTLKVTLHFIDLSVVNSWMEYKSDCTANNRPKRFIKDLLEFKIELAEALLSTRKRRRFEVDLSESEEQEENEPKPKNYQCSPLPGNSKRMDGGEHWPIIDKLSTARSCRMKNCTSRTRTRCEKCNVYLCLTSDRNCFKNFHTSP